MAENKKSFVLYADQKDLFNKLPDAVAGKLIKHIFSYVNDENPTTDDLLIEVAFEPIKRQMKRDLEKWEDKITRKSEGGRIGNLKRWNPELYERVIKQEISLEEAEEIVKNRIAIGSDGIAIKSVAKIADNVNVTDNVTVINKSKGGDKSPTPSGLKVSLPDRKTAFYESLVTYVPTYGKDMIRKFFDYWTELNKSQTKMRWELERVFEIKKRLSTWASRDNQFNSKPKQEDVPVRIRKSEANVSNEN